MQRMIKWPSIEQFRNVVRNVQHKASFIGMDDNGDAIYNNLKPKPTLKFEGTIKLHGTNASVCWDRVINGDMWCQSRETIITPEKDNAGFAIFVKCHEDLFYDLLRTAASIPDKRTDGETIVVFGEWCGGNIQTNVALNQVPKMFVIFGIAFVDVSGQKSYFTRQQVLDTVDGCREYIKKPEGTVPTDSHVYCIYDFTCYEAQIDFENPHEFVNELNLITERVGDECPVGKALGTLAERGPMTGEGVVWRCVTPGYEDSRFWMKVKDERHSKSKVKTLATVDVEKINNIKALAETVTHEGRLEQIYMQVFDTLNGGEADIKKMGEFIKAVMQDIFKEDIDVIVASGFTCKELNGPVSQIVRGFLLKKLEI